MRQLTDASGVVTMAQVYQPFGKASATYGTASSSYAFAGEMTDASGMQYLRARYYAPSTGRFISRDTWQGDPMQPLGYNLWLYAYSNPVMYTDPSGESVLAAIGATLLTGTVSGAVVGGVFGGVGNAIQQYRDTGKVDAGQVLKAAGKGAIVGAVAGATYSAGILLGSAAAGALAVGSTAAHVAGFATVAGSSVISGQATRLTQNALSGRKLTSGLGNPVDMIVDAVVGVTTFGLASRITTGKYFNYESAIVRFPPPKSDRGSFGGWNRGVRDQVFDEHGRECFYCGSTDDLTVDHMYPVKYTSQDGAYYWSDNMRNAWYNDVDNLIPLCRSCNSSKGAQTMMEWLFGYTSNRCVPYPFSIPSPAIFQSTGSLDN